MDGCTPLHVAAEAGSTEILSLMLSKNPDISIRYAFVSSHFLIYILDLFIQSLHKYLLLYPSLAMWMGPLRFIERV